MGPSLNQLIQNPILLAVFKWTKFGISINWFTSVPKYHIIFTFEGSLAQALPGSRAGVLKIHGFTGTRPNAALTSSVKVQRYPPNISRFTKFLPTQYLIKSYVPAIEARIWAELDIGLTGTQPPSGPKINFRLGAATTRAPVVFREEPSLNSIDPMAWITKPYKTNCVRPNRFKIYFNVCTSCIPTYLLTMSNSFLN